jgi:hypothetical protein
MSGLKYLSGNFAVSAKPIDSGTKVVFNQTAAPTGWVKDTTHDDKALRVVSGTASNGGTQAFTSVFGSGKTTASHTLSTPQLPAHNHPYVQTVNTNSELRVGPLVVSEQVYNVGTSYVGGSQGHTHNLTLDISYVDVIVATKE